MSTLLMACGVVDTEQAQEAFDRKEQVLTIQVEEIDPLIDQIFDLDRQIEPIEREIEDFERQRENDLPPIPVPLAMLVRRPVSA